MSCVDAYPETVKSQEQMLLYSLILQSCFLVNNSFTVFDSSLFSFRAEHRLDPESRSVVYYLVFNPVVYLDPGSSPG